MGTISFSAALEIAESQARARLDASLYERLSAAVALVRAGHVFQLSSGAWEVDSASKPDHVYHINGNGCSCEDSHFRAPKGYCKHRLAAHLAARTQQLLAQPPAPVVPVPEVVEPFPDNDAEPAAATAVSAPQPLPEAPASVNVRVTISGYEVQWTLRDTDEGRLAERLAQLLARYPKPQPQAPQPPASQPQLSPQQTGWCAAHDCTMRLNTGKDGRQWWSHKLPEGGFCKGR